MTSSTVSSESVARQERRDPCGTDSYPAAVSSKHVEWQEQGGPCSSDKPEWLQEFRENLVEDKVPRHRDSHASSSHESSLEPTPARGADSGEHSVYTHSRDRPEDHTYKVSVQKTHWRSRTSCQKIFGDLITADHKVLNEGCESRNNHRFTILVQDMATQWIESYPCKTKTAQETPKNLQKFLEPKRKPKVIYTNNSLEVGKACEDLPWKDCTSTPHRSETHGIPERVLPCFCERQVIFNLGLPGLFLGYALNAGWIWKGDIKVADIEELETMDASESTLEDSTRRK